MARTTVSIESNILSAGKKRAKALRYKSFSQYTEYLIERDTKDRPDHVMIRDESPVYGKKERHDEGAGSSAAA